jgi:membrane glycosyltransferase
VRGQVDPQLAVARAKMEDARTFDEAVSFLNTSETMAMLNDRSILEQLLDMETSQPDLIRRSV